MFLHDRDEARKWDKTEHGLWKRHKLQLCPAVLRSEAATLSISATLDPHCWFHYIFFFMFYMNNIDLLIKITELSLEKASKWIQTIQMLKTVVSGNTQKYFCTLTLFWPRRSRPEIGNLSGPSPHNACRMRVPPCVLCLGHPFRFIHYVAKSGRPCVILEHSLFFWKVKKKTHTPWNDLAVPSFWFSTRTTHLLVPIKRPASRVGTPSAAAWGVTNIPSVTSQFRSTASPRGYPTGTRFWPAGGSGGVVIGIGKRNSKAQHATNQWEAQGIALEGALLSIAAWPTGGPWTWWSLRSERLGTAAP